MLHNKVITQEVHKQITVHAQKMADVHCVEGIYIGISTV